MQKILFFVSLFFLPCFLIAQNIKGGIITGFNLAQVDGDEVYGFHKIGLNVGPMALVPLGNNFSFTLETLYNQKGSYQRPRFEDSLSGAYKVILNYLEVPVLLQYTDKDVVRVGTGFSWGRLVQFKEWEHEKRVDWDSPNGPYKRNDVDFLLDLQFKMFKGFYLDLRYAYSVSKIRTRQFLIKETGETWSRKQFNNLVTFRLIYIFKDKPGQKKEKE